MGGWSKKETHEAHEAVTQAIKQLNNPQSLSAVVSGPFSDLAISTPLELVETLSVSTQVVAGINYKASIHVALVLFSDMLMNPPLLPQVVVKVKGQSHS